LAGGDTNTIFVIQLKLGSLEAFSGPVSKFVVVMDFLLRTAG
jgi:hypothetical protein